MSRMARDWSFQEVNYCMTKLLLNQNQYRISLETIKYLIRISPRLDRVTSDDIERKIWEMHVLIINKVKLTEVVITSLDTCTC